MKTRFIGQTRTRTRVTVFLGAFLMIGAGCSQVSANPPTKFDTLAGQYDRAIRGLVDQFCLDCHNSVTREGDLDLQPYQSLNVVRREPETWQKVLDRLESGKMPPESAEQPSQRQRQTLVDWANRYLSAEAMARAGDPGPVVLRRLSNREYTYTIRDLTGVNSLDPVREFPVDGAAGEGFTNAGAALVMSPSLLRKYLDAAKEISRHAVLLPDGIAFSAQTTRRDWTEQQLTAIRDFYAKFTVPGGETSLNLQGVQFDTKDAGVIPLESYFQATIAERDSLTAGHKSIAAVAKERGLNAKYLGLLWKTLNESESSLLLDRVRRSWRTAKTEDASSLAATVQQWQQLLWQFATVGHIGKRDGPTAWQQPALPLTTSQTFKRELSEGTAENDLTVYLVVEDAGDGNANDRVLWEQPRIVLSNQRTLHLQDAGPIGRRTDQLIRRELARTADYLQAVREAGASQASHRKIAEQYGLNSALLANWIELVQVGESASSEGLAAPEVSGHYENKLSAIGGYASLCGWGSEQTPNLVVNRGDEAISFSTLTVPPRGVTMHPSPSDDAVVYWRSPFDGKIKIDGLIADADDHGGNGVQWRVERITGAGASTVAAGAIDDGAKATFRSSDALPVHSGDLIKLAVGARDRQHVFDTTHVDLTIKQVGNEARVWNLAKDIVDAIHDGNPLADPYGNSATWHLAAFADPETPRDGVVPGSALAKWRENVIQRKTAAELATAAESVQDVLTASDSGSLAAADASMRQRLLDWQGSLDWLGIATESFASAADQANIHTTAPSVLEFRIPAELASDTQLITTGKLDPVKGQDGTVQLRLSFSKPAGIGESSPRPGKIVVGKESEARRRLEHEIDEFRRLFPAALCYTQIVPVDEVVTLRLFYREDEHLRRLMLDPQQTARLDKLWNQLRFISREPIKLVDVFEQLWQYATQDADPSAFEPLREPIHERAAEFRRELAAAEPRHVDAVIEFAQRAWRRPLTVAEQDELRTLYRKLRQEELAHPAAVRMTLARVLAAPEFLYKLERPRPGEAPSPVSDTELATRLSYFLWASSPDDELRALADEERLRDRGALLGQTHRMLGDDRVRRLAVEFGCQWLGVRNFDLLDEKSERHFPEFVELRESMYEETIRFFTDFFQKNRSILTLLDADHTFVDDPLAEFYGFPTSGKSGWRRVSEVRDRGRGGILAMATTLARQSGASRTSPILRGNWVYESLLGQQLPNPPDGVPQLPDTVPDGLTERQLIERHSSDASCAKCHEKIDPYGFALEKFDAIGRARTTANTKSRLPDGRRIDGLDGLRRYLLEDRRDVFVRQFCRKLLGYALGRSVQLSDEVLLDEMIRQLKANDYRVGVAIERIVLSDQFQMIRGKNASDSFFLSREPD